MDSSLQVYDENLLILSRTVFENFQDFVRGNPLYNFFESDSPFQYQFRILGFIPEDHVSTVIQSIYNGNKNYSSLLEVIAKKARDFAILMWARAD